MLRRTQVVCVRSTSWKHSIFSMWLWVGVTGCGWLWLGVTGCGWVGKMVKPNNNRMKNVIKYVKSVKFLNVKLLNQLIVMEH